MIHDLQKIHVPVILKSPWSTGHKKQIQAQMGTASISQPQSRRNIELRFAKTLRLTLTTSPPWASLSFFPARRSDFTSATRPKGDGPMGT